MALKNILLIFTLASSCLVADLTWGQSNVPSPRFSPQQVEEPNATRPFAQPGIFNYDAQMFAPLEFYDSEQKEPNVGFYFSYERTYTSLNRAGQVGPIMESSVSVGSDWTWGNRFEFGWMSDADDGWAISYQKSNGTHFASGTDVLVANPLLVTTDFSHVEINKMFRQVLDNGDYFEPFVGLRYFSLSDNTLEDTTTNFNGTGSFNRFRQNVTNNAVGPQVGGRYNARRGRYRLTCESGLAATYNNQKYFATDILSVGAAVGVSERSEKSQSFMPAWDGQIELAYNLSRDFAFRGGIQVQYLWNGVARSNNLTTSLNPNSVLGPATSVDSRGLFDTNLVAAGFTFGVEWKR